MVFTSMKGFGNLITLIFTDANALDAETSFLKNAEWDENLLQAIEDGGKKFANVPADYRDQADKLGIGRAVYLAGNRPSYPALFPSANITSRDNISIDLEQTDAKHEWGSDGYGFNLTIAGWGDVNNDGTEDLVCLYQDADVGGAGGCAYAKALTRLKKDGPLFELPIKELY